MTKLDAKPKPIEVDFKKSAIIIADMSSQVLMSHLRQKPTQTSAMPKSKAAIP
jgi:hypothetical protein